MTTPDDDKYVLETNGWVCWAYIRQAYDGEPPLTPSSWPSRTVTKRTSLSWTQMCS